MKWLLTLIFSCLCTCLFAQANSATAKAPAYNEEEIYASNNQISEINTRVKPVATNSLPMAVSQMVNNLQEEEGKVLTYEVITGKEIRKKYYLAITQNDGVKSKRYYTKEGKIAKSILLFD